MSSSALKWALSLEGLKSSTKLVLIYMADYAGHGNLSFQCIPTLSKRAGLDRKTTIIAIKKMIDMGLIEDTGERRGSTKRIVVYRVIEGAGTIPETGQFEIVPKSVLIPKTAPLNSPENGLEIVPKTVHRDKNYIQKHKTLGQTPFDLFWLTYPNKVKKKTSKDIWRRKNLDSMAGQIVSNIQDRRRQDERWLGGFVPDPTTYLNQERWNDEYKHVDSQRRVSV